MKYILLFIYSLTISIYSIFFGDPVTLKTNFPPNAKAGTEFTAEITINKGTVAGFAKFQLELPQGFTAKESDSKGGSFSLTNQTAKIIWTSVPSDAEFTIKITIMADAAAAGEKIVTGKFSYIENNAKQQVEISPATINVQNESAVVTNTNTVTPETNTVAATTTDTSKKPFTKPDEATSPVSINRNITAGKSPDTYEVELKVKKDGIKGFAKLVEKTPDGFIAIGGKTDGATFTFSGADHTGKFIWTSIPQQEELTVSYKLMPKKGASIPNPASVEGEFSYLDNQETKKMAVARQELGQPAVTTNIVVETNTVTPTETTVTQNTVAATTTTTTTDPVNTNTTSTVATNTTEPVNTQTTVANNTQPDVNVQKNSNVHFSVQVGAFRNGVNVDALSARYSLSGVSTEMHEGYTKCITGKHEAYKSARDARETIKSKGVSDAFVTAYNTGRRITVQEALMITSQRWIR